MRVRTGLALVVMLATALGWSRAKRPDLMRTHLGRARPLQRAA